MDANEYLLGFAFLLLGMVFFAHLYFMHRAIRELSRLSRIRFAYETAKTPEIAISNAVALENELASLDGAKEALEAEAKKSEHARKGPPIGFRGPNGAVVKFMTPPRPDFLARIPSERLVYES